MKLLLPPSAPPPAAPHRSVVKRSAPIGPISDSEAGLPFLRTPPRLQALPELSLHRACPTWGCTWASSVTIRVWTGSNPYSSTN
ncbi:hypothetical protein H920_19150 [Fukomys damarensis]|uniref:Uncharacterized protein n=1 Tax=Fukomys damarensis TaxID=885580 RepID=A0A091CL30_FUKDA|nr:hypothetical protein H920_19150 [Fukomys damarensis]